MYRSLLAITILTKSAIFAIYIYSVLLCQVGERERGTRMTLLGCDMNLPRHRSLADSVTITALRLTEV